MSIRKANRRRLKKYPIGDMRHYIGIYERRQKAPSFDNVDVKEDFVKLADEWAFVKSLDVSRNGALGQDFFDGVNLAQGASHLITIRYREYTSENFVKYEGQIYEILRTSNPENRNMYLEMYIRQMGDENLPVNQ